jgi:DNA invertase Pin-like site-specific DNA recombinase
VKISERTKAGLQRVRTQGKILGRPNGFEKWKDKLATMQEAGYSQERMSRETRLSYNTIKTYLHRINKNNET